MEFFQYLLPLISQGGSAAVITILLAIVAVLIWDRKSLTKELIRTTQKVYDAKDSETRSIKEIVNRYHKGNLDLVQALTEIKIVLVSIQNERHDHE
jgi:hypothetical protein